MPFIEPKTDKAFDLEISEMIAERNNLNGRGEAWPNETLYDHEAFASSRRSQLYENLVELVGDRAARYSTPRAVDETTEVRAAYEAYDRAVDHEGARILITCRELEDTAREEQALADCEYISKERTERDANVPNGPGKNNDRLIEILRQRALESRANDQRAFTPGSLIAHSRDAYHASEDVRFLIGEEVGLHEFDSGKPRGADESIELTALYATYDADLSHHLGLELELAKSNERHASFSGDRYAAQDAAATVRAVETSIAESDAKRASRDLYAGPPALPEGYVEPRDVVKTKPEKTPIVSRDEDLLQRDTSESKGLSGPDLG